MMNLVEKMYAKVAKKVCGTTDVTYQGTEIHLGGKWERLTMKDAVKKYSGADYADWATDEDARSVSMRKYISISSALCLVLKGRADAPISIVFRTGVSTSKNPAPSKYSLTAEIICERFLNVFLTSGFTIKSSSLLR